MRRRPETRDEDCLEERGVCWKISVTRRESVRMPPSKMRCARVETRQSAPSSRVKQGSNDRTPTSTLGPPHQKRHIKNGYGYSLHTLQYIQQLISPPASDISATRPSPVPGAHTQPSPDPHLSNPASNPSTAPRTASSSYLSSSVPYAIASAVARR